MPCRAGHGDRTAHYSLALGEAVGLSRDQLHHLELAALLHDLGLLTLPRHIASAQDCLDMDDYALFQSHPRAGAHLLEPHRFLRIAARWIALHHERWDGYGYPFGLRGEFIPLGARILAVADTFDALCSRSSCHDAFTQEDVLALLLNRAGSQLDPHLVETFSAGVAQTTDFRSATSGRWFGEG
jgi:HD-GYP domain-containing protein (c-di-GMP phosphodiesterase class II)